jgi:hypothetical protein
MKNKSKSKGDSNKFSHSLDRLKFINEIRIDVYDDEIFDDSVMDFVSSGKLQIHLNGSRRSYQELGKLLIQLSEYETDDPDLHLHYDDINNSENEDYVNLIIHGIK